MKDPAVLFYTSDFITGTLTMTDEQRGKYIILLCLQHQQGFLTEEDMLHICKSYDEKIFSKFDKNAQGHYHNRRMLEESQKRNKYIESRRENRKQKPEDMNKICETYDKHMENININEDIDKEEGLLRKKEKNFELRETSFISEVWQYKEQYSEIMLKAFINYWTEKNKSRSRMRFETEKTFEISKRLNTWASRDNKFSPKKAEPAILSYDRPMASDAIKLLNND